MIPVTKPTLPNRTILDSYLDSIYSTRHLSNFGPLSRELEAKLCERFGVKHTILVCNGTVALEVLLRALDIKGEVLTTPFSFIATTSALKWLNIEPVYADIEADSLNISTEQTRRNLSSNIEAILPVHVFGAPCENQALEELAKINKVPLIYDAAHAFDVYQGDQSVFSMGTASITSFHATKLFHTVEGGAIFTNDEDLASRVRKLTNFGLDPVKQNIEAGTNGKMSEFNAAVGLTMLRDIDAIIERRIQIIEDYKSRLNGFVTFQKIPTETKWNGSYCPVLFENEHQLLTVLNALKQEDIHIRRYFYPSLNTVFTPDQQMPISEDISSRIACLPVYPDLEDIHIDNICKIIKSVI